MTILAAVDITIVIPTHQRRASLARVLSGLDLQTYPADRIEVVVVCDGCTDGTQDMLAASSHGYRVVALELPGNGPAAARNAGVEAAGAPLVLFLDDDVIPSPGLVHEHVTSHERAGAIAVLGPMLAPSSRLSPWLAAEARGLRKQYAAMTAELWIPTARQFYTGNVSIGREYVLRVGGFDETYRRAEDVQLAHRLEAAGLEFRFNPEAAGTHIPRRPYRAWLENAHAYGGADVRMAQSIEPRILGLPARELHYRHPLTRAAVRFTLRHPGAAKAAAAAALVALYAARAAGWDRGVYGLCALLFNSAYWSGVSDALGGADAALEVVRSETEHADRFGPQVRAEERVVAQRLGEP